jgi:uncharacterized membrane protein YphA (DoxX/SURF4 family)
MTNLLAATFKPAVESSSRASATALAALRILAGLLWLYNVSWKRPPDFGQDSGSGLYGFTQLAVEHVVLPNFLIFGWMVLVVETLLAVLLLTGTLVRLAALIGVGQSLAIGLSVAGTPGEWPWAYWMMIGIHVALLFTSAGRAAAVDAVRADASDRGGSSRSSATRLLLGWGVVVGLTGLVALALAFDEDPLASVGARIGGPDLSISLGSYNVVGAVILLGVAALMCAAAALKRPALALGSAAVAVLAALSLYVQLSRTDVWLGGSNTSAAFFLCAAVVSGATARHLQSSTQS